MNQRLLETKFHIPSWRPGGVVRPRLRERLQRGLQECRKLTLISAPAGYGKTTLVAEWIAPKGEAAAFKVAWLSLDETDNDPARFFQYWLAALRHVDDTVGQDLQTLLEMPQMPPPTAMLEQLINDLAALPYTIVLVLDDYHVVQAQLVHAAIEFMLEHQPQNLHLVICTRQDPPFALAQLRVRASITEIRADDLRFTTDEARQFFAQTMKLDLAVDAVCLLEARTEGWIAGLQLAALSLQDQHAATEFAQQFSGTHRYVIDYLVEQVLQRQSAAVRTFLVRTAVLDRLCAAVCDALWQEEDSAVPATVYLTYLEQANLFLIPLDNERRWYRYHQLFADSLRAELAPAEQALLHRRAAHWFAAHALIGEAIQHAHQAQDFALAAHLIAQHSLAILQRGEVATLLDWLRLLPAEFVQANNSLVTSQAYTLFFTGQIAAASEVIEVALATDSGEGDPIMRGRLLALRAWFPALQNPLTTGETARAALALIEPEDALSRSFALIPLGHAQRANGDLVGSTQTFREAYREGKRANFPLALLGAVYNLAFNLNEQGQRHAALAMCEEVLARYVDKRGKPLPLVGIAYVPLALLHYEANALLLAREYAQKGLDLSRQSISAMILGGDAEYILAQVHIACGEHEAAIALLRTLQTTAHRSGMVRVAATLAAWEADLCLRIGALEPAGQWAAAQGFTPDGIVMTTSGRHPLIYIHLLMAQGQWRAAQKVAERFAVHARDRGRQVWLINVQLLQAAIARHLGEDATVICLLAQAVQLAAPENYCRLFLDHAQALADLLPRVRHVAPSFVDQLIAAFGMDRQSAAVQRQPLPASQIEPLSEREIEILTLLSAGLSNQEIARRLFITVGTTKWHLNHIYAKLGVKGRTQAIVSARVLKLI